MLSQSVHNLFSVRSCAQKKIQYKFITNECYERLLYCIIPFDIKFHTPIRSLTLAAGKTQETNVTWGSQYRCQSTGLGSSLLCQCHWQHQQETESKAANSAVATRRRQAACRRRAVCEDKWLYWQPPPLTGSVDDDSLLSSPAESYQHINVTPLSKSTVSVCAGAL